MITLAKKPVLKAKNALLTLVVYVPHLWLAKRAIMKRLAKILFWILNLNRWSFGKARLKEVLHVPPCTNIGQHGNPVCYIV